VVTVTTLPPRPPEANLPKPSASGKARVWAEAYEKIPKRKTIIILFISYISHGFHGNNTSAFVVAGGARGFAFAYVCSHFQVLRVSGICVEILPVVEETGETDVVVGCRSIGDVDTHFNVLEAGHFMNKTLETLFDYACVFRFAFSFRFVGQTKEYYVFYHNETSPNLPAREAYFADE
jgi:hypothetical protein